MKLISLALAAFMLSLTGCQVSVGTKDEKWKVVLFDGKHVNVANGTGRFIALQINGTDWHDKDGKRVVIPPLNNRDIDLTFVTDPVVKVIDVTPDGSKNLAFGPTFTVPCTGSQGTYYWEVGPDCFGGRGGTVGGSGGSHNGGGYNGPADTGDGSGKYYHGQ